jgi:zinc protease
LTNICSPLLRGIATMLMLLAIALPARAQDQPAIAITDFTLGNGLRVILLPSKRAPLISHSVWYRVGATDEFAGKTGLAHFLEHLMFKGTKKFPRTKFDSLMKANGAYSNAFTTNDYTVYLQRIASDQLALVMELEADRMKNLVLTEADVLPERDVVRQERLQRIENDPTGPFWEKVSAAIYGSHPYGRPTIGLMADVEKLTMDDALNFYRLYYQPQNAVVVIAGDVDVAVAKGLAEKFYGQIANDASSRPRAELPPLDVKPVDKRLELSDSRVQSPYVVATYLVPSVIDPATEEATALSFFAEIFASGIDSKLGQDVILNQKLAADAGYIFNNDTRGPGSMSIYVVPNPGRSLKEVETAFRAALARQLQDGVTQQDLDRTRKRAYGNLVYDYDSADGIMRKAGQRAMLDGAVAKAFDTRDWERVTVDTVNAAARKYLAADRGTLAFLARNAADLDGAAKQ